MGERREEREGGERDMGYAQTGTRVVVMQTPLEGLPRFENERGMYRL